MNREMEVRVWSTAKKEYFLDDRYMLTFNGQLKFIDFSTEEIPLTIHESGYVIQWCTGVKDKTGKKIYEGDILNLAELNYEVYFIDGQFIATCPYYSKHHWPKFENFAREARCAEVVGNIFENPELLKR